MGRLSYFLVFIYKAGKQKEAHMNRENGQPKVVFSVWFIKESMGQLQ